jgi:hypothetical protein
MEFQKHSPSCTWYAGWRVCRKEISGDSKFAEKLSTDAGVPEEQALAMANDKAYWATNPELRDRFT